MLSPAASMSDATKIAVVDVQDVPFMFVGGGGARAWGPIRVS